MSPFCVIFVLSMKIPLAYRSKLGQTSIEYLLLLAVVAVIVIASFGPGSLISQVHDSAQGYYNTVTRVIMGENPQPINGGWCPVTSPSGSGPTVMYRACECPAPAFGGAYCSGGSDPSCPADQICVGAKVIFTNVTPCGPCPPGQQCNAQGVCVGCSLDCSSVPNSSPDSTCTKCECNSGTYWNGTGCVYCPQCQAYDAVQKKCVDAATTICPPSGNWWCNPNAPPGQECQCWQNYCWNGTGCVWTGHSCP